MGDLLSVCLTELDIAYLCTKFDTVSSAVPDILSVPNQNLNGLCDLAGMILSFAG